MKRLFGLSGVVVSLALVTGCSDDGSTDQDGKGPVVDLGAIPDVGPMPDMKASCAPGDPPVLHVQLDKKAGTYVVRATNVGCNDAVRLVGCCAEGDPGVELRQADGSWKFSDCIPKPQMCCAAMPHCSSLKRGQAIDIPVALDKCPTGVYRAVVAYAVACASPNPWDTKTPLSGTSNPVAVTK